MKNTKKTVPNGKKDQNRKCCSSCEGSKYWIKYFQALHDQEIIEKWQKKTRKFYKHTQKNVRGIEKTNKQETVSWGNIWGTEGRTTTDIQLTHSHSLSQSFGPSEKICPPSLYKDQPHTLCITEYTQDREEVHLPSL